MWSFRVLFQRMFLRGVVTTVRLRRLHFTVTNASANEQEANITLKFLIFVSLWTTISLRSLWDMKIRGSVELCSFTCSCWSSCSIKIPSYFRVKNHLSTSTEENVWRVAPCLLAGWHVLIYLIILALLEFGNDKSKLWLRCPRNGKSWSICIPYVYFWVAFKDVFWKHGNLSCYYQPHWCR